MYIPQSFNDKIAETFYDKIIQILNPEVKEDAEGGVSRKGLISTEEFKGNVSFSNCKKIQEEYGLDYDIDISITTNYKLLELNNLLKYQNKIYSVSEMIVSDSHVLVAGRIWRQ